MKKQWKMGTKVDGFPIENAFAVRKPQLASPIPSNIVKEKGSRIPWLPIKYSLPVVKEIVVVAHCNANHLGSNELDQNELKWRMGNIVIRWG